MQAVLTTLHYWWCQILPVLLRSRKTFQQITRSPELLHELWLWKGGAVAVLESSPAFPLEDGTLYGKRSNRSVPGHNTFWTTIKRFVTQKLQKILPQITVSSWTVGAHGTLEAKGTKVKVGLTLETTTSSSGVISSRKLQVPIWRWSCYDWCTLLIHGTAEPVLPTTQLVFSMHGAMKIPKLYNRSFTKQIKKWDLARRREQGLLSSQLRKKENWVSVWTKRSLIRPIKLYRWRETNCRCILTWTMEQVSSEGFYLQGNENARGVWDG